MKVEKEHRFSMNSRTNKKSKQRQGKNLTSDSLTRKQAEESLALTHECQDFSRHARQQIKQSPENIISQSGVYQDTDFGKIQNIFPVPNNIYVLKSLDELLRRDERRKEDGFPKKIRLGKIMKPSPYGRKKVVVIPTVEEEKFLHDTRPLVDEPETGGSGEGQEGEVIAEEPVHSTNEGSEPGSGEGGETFHEMESTAYELGKILTEEFKLPNIKDKGKKRALTKYIYDLTDKNRGYGQVLDKKATLKKIIETNLALGNIKDYQNIDPTTLIVPPKDKVYRTLSKEKEYESQAVVFFVRDYSASMQGLPTNIVVSQHLLIYIWLMYQYENHVEIRFILHDTEAKEVEDFYTYYNTSVAGGTNIATAYKLVNDILKKENLAENYNIYVFHGTDGEDWDNEGKEAILELKKILLYVNRIGITIASSLGNGDGTVVERYLKKAGVLEHGEILRLDVIKSDSAQERVMEGLRKLIS
jgi:hypothetical protein